MYVGNSFLSSVLVFRSIQRRYTQVFGHLRSLLPRLGLKYFATSFIGLTEGDFYDFIHALLQVLEGRARDESVASFLYFSPFILRIRFFLFFVNYSLLSLRIAKGKENVISLSVSLLIRRYQTTHDFSILNRKAIIDLSYWKIY